MKKNVILLVIDSLEYERLSTAKDRGLKNLFLEEFEKECITATNMFSQAPFTEAASMGLYCGQRTMDKGGYLEKFNTCPVNLFEAFRNDGYDVFFNGYQPHIFPSTLIRGVNHYYYNGGFNFKDGFWYYRLKHYREVYLKKELTEFDYKYLNRAFIDNFNEWKLFLQRWIDRDKSLELIRHTSSGFNAERALDMLITEIEKFELNKKKYINRLFKQGEKHILFGIPTMKMDEKIKNRDFLKETSKRYKKIINKIWFKNLKLNLKNNFLKKETFKEFKRIFKEGLSDKSMNYFLRYCFAWYTLLFDPDLKKRIAPDYDFFKASPDIDKHFDQFIKWRKDTENIKNPYLACLHVEGMHNPEVFFSHDSEDRSLLDKQFAKANKFVESLSNDYKGSITYDLSINHYSERIEEIMDKLSKLNILDENTYFVLTSDHGFSFTGDPVRERWVTNFYLENYKIPFMIYNKNIQSFEYSDMASGDDLPSTLVDLCEVERPKNFTGKSILRDNNPRDYIIIEYMGSGCPDIHRRDFHYAIYDNEYFISAYVKLKDELTIDNMKDIFNIQKDPKQLENLIGKNPLKNKRIKELFVELQKRHNDIRKENLKI